MCAGNIVLLVIGFLWALGGAIKDNFNFVNFILFTSKCEASGRTEMERCVLHGAVPAPAE